MEQEAVAPLVLEASCVDSIGVYLLLRECGVDTIGEAVRLLCRDGAPTPDEFDAVADGLCLYEIELEDDRRADVLDLKAVREANKLGSHVPAFS